MQRLSKISAKLLTILLISSCSNVQLPTYPNLELCNVELVDSEMIIQGRCKFRGSDAERFLTGKQMDKYICISAKDFARGENYIGVDLQNWANQNCNKSILGK